MRSPAAGWLALGLLGLASLIARGDDAHRSAPTDPDPGFLEFLGSVDRLAEVSPDYLAQARNAQAGNAAARPRLTARNRMPSPAPPPPAPPSGAKNNE
jgi:hypothetical protein